MELIFIILLLTALISFFNIIFNVGRTRKKWILTLVVVVLVGVCMLISKNYDNIVSSLLNAVGNFIKGIFFGK